MEQSLARRSLLQNLEELQSLFRMVVEVPGAILDVTQKQRVENQSISRDAGQLLLEAGAVDSLDEGIVRFHQRIGIGRPSLRKLLKELDVRRGRGRFYRPRSEAQKVMDRALKAGEVRRVKGRVKGYAPAVKKRLKEIKARTQAREKQQRQTLRRLGVRR